MLKLFNDVNKAKLPFFFAPSLQRRIMGSEQDLLKIINCLIYKKKYEYNTKEIKKSYRFVDLGLHI